MLNSNTCTADSNLTLTRFELANERQNELRADRAETLGAREHMARIASTPHLVRGHASAALGRDDAETRTLRKRAEDQFKKGPAEFPYAVRFNADGTAQRGKACVLHGGCVLAVDIDDGLTADSFEVLAARLSELRAHAVFSTTWSHRMDPAGAVWAGRLRVLVDRNVMAHELQAARLGLGELAGVTIDVAASGQHTLFFNAACPPERAEMAFHREWVGGPLVVDELVELGAAILEQAGLEARAAARRRLEQRGTIVALGADVPASKLDCEAAHAALRIDCGQLAGMRDGRKRRAHVLGLRWGATVRIGGLDESTARVAFAAVLGPEHIDHFERGFEAGLRGEAREIPPVRAYDRLVEREVRETSGKRRAREQLAAQARAASDAIGIDAAREQLGPDMRAAIETGGVHILQYPAGTGKSHQGAQVIAELIRAGYQVRYAGPNHNVVRDTVDRVPADVLDRVAHPHSPLVEAGDAPVCRRANELKLKVLTLDVPQRQVCSRCPFRDGCDAREAYEARQQRAETADALFVSHVGILQGVDAHSRAETVLIVDEMPGVFDLVELSRSDLKMLAGRWSLTAARVDVASVVRRLAALWLGDESVDQVELQADLAALAELRGGLLENPYAELSEVTAKRMTKAADAVRVAHAGVAVEHLSGGAVQAQVPTDAYRELSLGGWRAVLLLTATPCLPALPGATVHACDVYDACPWHERTMRYRSDRGKRAVEAEIPWHDLCPYIARLRQAARGGRILLVTFKSLEDALRANPERVGGLEGIELAHYGAVHGLNKWFEGGTTPCSVFATFGDPWMAWHGTLEGLGVSGDELWTAATVEAAGELYQAHERARAVFAKWPVQFFHEGGVVPGGWHEGNAAIETLEDAGAAATAALAELAELGIKLADVARACDVSLRAVEDWRRRKSVPAEHGPALEALRPKLRERLLPDLSVATKLVRSRTRKAAAASWAQRLAAVEALDAQACADWEARSSAFASYVRELLAAS
jgi:hypothetical protein